MSVNESQLGLGLLTCAHTRSPEEGEHMIIKVSGRYNGFSPQLTLKAVPRGSYFRFVETARAACQCYHQITHRAG